MTTLTEIRTVLSGLFPEEIAESWDPVGLQIGDPSQVVRRMGFALDATPELVAKAASLDLDLLVVHHPLFFSPLKSVDLSTPMGRIVGTAIKSDMAIVAAHTNLDSAVGGLNDFLAEKIGLEKTRALVAADPDAKEGLGRFGSLPEAMTLDAFAVHVKSVLGLDGVRVTGTRKRVSTVALCTGSGASLIGDAMVSGADVYVTGDMKHHEAMDAIAEGACIIDAGHWGTERIVVELLETRLMPALSQAGIEDVKWVALPESENPFRWM